LRFALIGNPISVGRIFSILCVISIIKFYNIKDKNLGKRLIYIFSFILGLIVVIATNSRGPFFALIITLLIYFLFFAKIKVWKSILFLLLFIAVLGMILTILPESFYSRYKLFSGKEIHISEKQISVFSTIDERQQYINQAINYLVENPQAIFIGAGAGSFSHISFNRDQRLYPHNIFIEILLETGIVGFVLFSGVFLFIIFDIFQISRYLDEQDYNNLVMWLLLLILFFLNAQVSGDINDNRMMWFFEGGVIGLILYFIKQKKITVIHNY
jgi:O-antigen ligase